MMKISFIVPVYNTAGYLGKCLDSLLSQDLLPEEYEIIVVDDGSTDRSPDIIREYEKQHQNITVLTQPNSGQSAARNRGLDIAKGEYIWFVDSDDYIEGNILQECLHKCHVLQLDILLVCADNVSGTSRRRRQQYNSTEPDMVISGKEFLSYPQFQNCVPFCLYKRQFLEDRRLRFMEGVYHEDNEILPRIFYPAGRVSMVNKVFYHVNLREGSTTRSVNPKKAYDLVKVSRSLSRYLEEHVEKEDYGIMANLVSLAINGSLSNTIGMGREERKKLSETWYQNRDLFRVMRLSASRYYRLEAWLFRLFPHQTGIIYRILQKLAHFKKRLYL